MKIHFRSFFPILLIVGIILFHMNQNASYASVSVGKPAPDFTLLGHDGNNHNLSDYRGKIVVLEWFNHQCPFVRKHYDGKNMQQLQQTYSKQDIVWLSINSSAPGKQGHLDSAQTASRVLQEEGATPTLLLMDPSGEVGKRYGATNTPQMFVIDKEGTLAYMGAIDSIPSANSADIKQSENYVVSALTSLLNNQKIATPVTRPYGCSVKY